MKKYLKLLLILPLTLLLSACSEDEGEESEDSNTTIVQGWHFQGRDCLACHNVDLNEDKHLLVAGTLYKSASVSDQDDLNNVCGGEFVVKFLDENWNTVYNSQDYEDPNSKGYEAKGNLFILRRTLSTLSAETFSIQIADKNGTVFAVSNYSHDFSAADYDIDKAADFANRVSCNSCHIKGGVTSPLYVQANVSKCK